jgi:high-affinity nickel-transport protein
MNADTQSVNSSLMDSDRKWSLRPLINKAERQHKRLPGIRKIPLRAIAIILFIAFINIIVWIAAAIVLVRC